MEKKWVVGMERVELGVEVSQSERPRDLDPVQDVVRDVVLL